MDGMILREYRTEDCPEMAKLFYETVHTVNAKDYSPEQLDAWAMGQVDIAAWDASFLRHHTVVAERDGMLVGFGDLDGNYLDRLYVHKDFQDQGIATVICDALEKMAAGTVTTHASITARPFFEGRGYRVVKPQLVVCRGVEMRNFVMKKG